MKPGIKNDQARVRIHRVSVGLGNGGQLVANVWGSLGSRQLSTSVTASTPSELGDRVRELCVESAWTQKAAKAS